MSRGNLGINASLHARGEAAGLCGRRYELAKRAGRAPDCTFGADFRAWLGPVEADAYNHLLPTTWRLHFDHGRRLAAEELDKGE